MKYIIILAIILCSCSSNEVTTIKGEHTTDVPKTDKQINLTILLDLSDRIDPKINPATPEHFERDSALIKSLTDYFLNQMKSRGAFRAKGKMRLMFRPYPANPGINLAAKNLNIDLSKMAVKEKKIICDTLNRIVTETITNIYKSTINQAKWSGSDIWRFFKNDVKDVAIDKDSSYRNILVVFTDGYIYHEDSKDKEGNRYSYILPDLLNKYKLRKDNNWAEKMDKLNFGLICKRSDLEQLEVLVLEITPSAKYKNDEDIIRKIMDKWFAEMKVKKWKIINSDLPEFTKQKIENFIRQ
jgi:hypothetical protein